MEKNKITKEMSFSEIVEKYPEAVEILFEKGMHCIGCGMAAFETLEQGAMVHGIDADELIEEINNKLDKNSSFKKRSSRKTNTIKKKITKSKRKK